MEIVKKFKRGQKQKRHDTEQPHDDDASQVDVNDGTHTPTVVEGERERM